MIVATEASKFHKGRIERGFDFGHCIDSRIDSSFPNESQYYWVNTLGFITGNTIGIISITNYWKLLEMKPAFIITILSSLFTMTMFVNYSYDLYKIASVEHRPKPKVSRIWSRWIEYFLHERYIYLLLFNQKTHLLYLYLIFIFYSFICIMQFPEGNYPLF